MNDDFPVKVAIIGASGIGKHHAKWWALEGALVCAFAGRTVESVQKADEGLRALFPFTGRGYTDICAMLDVERPDIVDVCSPSPFHYQHAKAALEAGCHVLCEKPFVYDPQAPHAVLLEQARALAGLAKEKGRQISVCTQYAAGARLFDEIWRESHPDELISHYHGHLEAPAKNRPPDPFRVWVDLSPHPISVLLRLAPQAVLDPATLDLTFDGYAALASFRVTRPALPPLECLIATRNALAPPFNVRHFKYNGFTFEIEGRNDADGVYCSQIETPCGGYARPDLMRLLIRDFLGGHPAPDIDESIKNLDIMLAILGAANEQFPHNPQQERT